MAARLCLCGKATHGRGGEPLRAAHGEPKLPVRLTIQLIRPQEARPCGRKVGAVDPSAALGRSCSGLCKTPTKGRQPKGKRNTPFPTSSVSSQVGRSGLKSSLRCPPRVGGGASSLTLLNKHQQAPSVRWGETQPAALCCKGLGVTEPRTVAGVGQLVHPATLSRSHATPYREPDPGRKPGGTAY